MLPAYPANGAKRTPGNREQEYENASETEKAIRRERTIDRDENWRRRETGWVHDEKQRQQEGLRRAAILLIESSGVLSRDLN